MTTDAAARRRAFPREDTSDQAVRVEVFHNIGLYEGIYVWTYEPHHPMTRVFAASVDATDFGDSALCERAFLLLNIGHNPLAEAGFDDEPDPRAVAYRKRGNRSLMTADVVAITRPGRAPLYYAIAFRGVTSIPMPLIVNRPGELTAPLD